MSGTGTRTKPSRGLALADILSAQKTITIDLSRYGYEGCEPLSITFRTNFWTAAAQARYFADGVRLQDSTYDLLRESILSWNLTNDGEPCPISNETFDLLNFDLWLGIVQEMIQAVSPNPTTSGS